MTSNNLGHDSQTQPAATPRFPALAAAQDLSFVRPMAGLPDLAQFTLAPFDDSGALFTLTSSMPGGPQFFLAVPQVFFPNYYPKLPGTVLADIGLNTITSTGSLVLETTSSTQQGHGLAREQDTESAQAPERKQAQEYLLVILTLGADLSEHTANLSAPIVVNPNTWAAVQIVLEDEQFSVRTPLTVN